MDDGVLVGKKEDLVKAINVIQKFGFGINLNLKKCEIFKLDPEAKTEEFPKEILRINELSNLGIPISHEIEYLKNCMKKLKIQLKELELLDHAQSSFLILKHCFGALKLNHIFRCCATSSIVDELNSLDELQNLSLEFLLKCKFSSSGLIQAHFSPSEGGLGIHYPSIVAPAAFLASRISTS